MFTGCFYYISLDEVWNNLQTLYQYCAWALKPVGILHHWSNLSNYVEISGVIHSTLE